MSRAMTLNSWSNAQPDIKIDFNNRDINMNAAIQLILMGATVGLIVGWFIGRITMKRKAVRVASELRDTLGFSHWDISSMHAVSTFNMIIKKLK